jgi:hypothetical protein
MTCTSSCFALATQPAVPDDVPAPARVLDDAAAVVVEPFRREERFRLVVIARRRE